MHTTPSNKVYIGITSQDPLKRWGNGSNYKRHQYFYSAIKKYGWNNIKHEILFDNLTENEAKQKEVELIAKHKSMDRNFGYNLTRGGDGVKGYTPSEESKKKCRETLAKMYENPEFRERQRLAKPRGEQHHFYGKHFSAEHIEKLRLSHLGKKRGPHSEETKAKIANSNTGKKKPHVGVPRSPECVEKMVQAHCKSVLQFTKDNKLIQEYASGKIAAQATGATAQSISRCCLGTQKTAKGFIWKFKNNYMEEFKNDKLAI
jgi:group I intron endonuclease